MAWLTMRHEKFGRLHRKRSFLVDPLANRASSSDTSAVERREESLQGSGLLLEDHRTL